MFVLLLLVTTLLLCADAIDAAAPPKPTRDRVLLFSYFTHNGEHGLRLAWSEDGYAWHPVNDAQPLLPPQVGEARLMRDPHLFTAGDGTFHLVWTTAWWGKSFGHASSDDLVNWSKQQAVPIMQHEPSATNVWAPEAVWDPQHERFVIFFASTVPERIAVIEGDDHNHRIYVTTTTDFVTFTAPKLFFDPGYNVIDSSIAWNEADKTWVMFFKDERKFPEAKKHLLIARAPSLDGPWEVFTESISGRDWAEGPSAVFHDGVWKLYFDRYTRGGYGLLTSRDLHTWTDETSKLKFPRGARHGTVIEVPRAVVETLIEKTGGNHR
jgi:hypothetical protein